ncbi:hypothetical protein VNI00_001600 [Paramarasmius palmivorus]|uniref:Peroxin domain-containing protein n=1 Tax=Paramarasmius palmivorus TaxID=297713 RepID=A0AAW0E469_9AGAR
MALNYVQPQAQHQVEPSFQLSEDESWDELDADSLDETKTELSESQLRELYDNEEIERFLTLFATNVTEVQIPKSPPPGTPRTENIPSNSDGSQAPIAEESQSLSENIALNYLLPILPPSPPDYPFTLGRLRLTTQRLYLSTVPVYGPFLRRLVKLATWEDKSKSTTYCSIYWFLWYHNLLLPSLILRVLYCLVRRRLLPYPTASELRQRFAEIDKAEELGDEVSARLVSSSGFGLKEMWRLARVFAKPSKPKKAGKDKGKEKSKGKKGKEKAQPSEEVDIEDETQQQDHDDNQPVGDDRTILDDPKDTQCERDIKRTALHSAVEVADLHERIHNLFIWRRPSASQNYGILIFLIFLTTLLLPAQYIAKLFYFIIGVLFWHVSPIIAALPREDRKRLPPILAEVPTDSDFAMELISQRVAAGQDVRPPRRRRQKAKKGSPPHDHSPGPSTERETNSRSQSPGMKNWSEVDKRIDWKKWGDRAAIGKAWAVDKRLFGNKDTWPQESNLPQSPLVPPPATAMGRPNSPVETHTFPCHHTTAPGLITLSPSMFYFTPIMSVNPKVAFPMNYVVSVKKAGLLKGVSVKWCDPKDNQEHEEVFKWVGGRDELFARLVGTDARKWIAA